MDPYSEGAAARLDGVPEEKNPYDLEKLPDEHMSWNDGWLSIDAEDETDGE